MAVKVSRNLLTGVDLVVNASPATGTTPELTVKHLTPPAPVIEVTTARTFLGHFHDLGVLERKLTKPKDGEEAPRQTGGPLLGWFRDVPVGDQVKLHLRTAYRLEVTLTEPGGWNRVVDVALCMDREHQVRSLWEPAQPAWQPL